MQLISVERWTFWAGIATAFLGPLTTAVVGNLGWLGSASSSDSLAGWLTIAFFLFLASVALEGTRDPSVRRVPAHTDT